MKFYLMVEGYDSVGRVGQDLTDELVGVREYVGAKKVMEDYVLPLVARAGLIGRMVQVRSQYAVILAWCGDHRGAIIEMQRLEPYLEGAEAEQKQEVERQTALITGIISEALRVAGRQPMEGAWDERCPCGSGLKFKKCHGA